MNSTEIQHLQTTLAGKVQLMSDYRHMHQYYLAALDFHTYIGNSLPLKKIIQKLISEERIAPIYLQQIYSDFILHQSLKHGQTTAKLKYVDPLFYSKELEDKYHLMQEFAELMVSDYDYVKKHPGEIIFDPNKPIIKTDRDEEFYNTQKLYNDIVEELDLLNKPPISRLDFDAENSILYLLGESVTISKRAESDGHDLLRTLFMDKSRIWNNDEILDDWKLSVDADVPKNKIYQAGKAVNRVISDQIHIKDFLDVTTKKISINKRYLRE